MPATNQPPRRAGRHFLQIPGPSPVPDRIMRAMAMPVLDHRGPEFQKLGMRVLGGIKTIFKTKNPVIIYPASGTGAWEAALANVLSPGDHVLMYETGHFATLWKSMAAKLGIEPEFIASDWRGGVDANKIEARLRADIGHKIKAVCVVHNETSTGATSHIDEVRKAIDAAGHPALLMVDTISGPGIGRLPARRMGRGRYCVRFAEGADAAARHLVQRHLRQGARRRQDCQAAEAVLVVGGNDPAQQTRFLPVHRPRPTCSMG